VGDPAAAPAICHLARARDARRPGGAGAPARAAAGLSGGRGDARTGDPRSDSDRYGADGRGRRARREPHHPPVRGGTGLARRGRRSAPRGAPGTGL
ncbi:MAG: hypothetical protein AVDCRST_MAG40-1445, partial [uncultured Gemmatimonadaceae bacterium]